MPIAAFNRFEIELPDDAVTDCSHAGACDDDVAHWALKIARPAECTPDALRAELKESGAWDADQLADDAANWQRIVWIAAGNLKEEAREEAEENRHYFDDMMGGES